jgi:peptidoglycan/LPS O-acetylase OafA/YrhL
MASLKGAIALFIVAYHYWAWGVGTPDDWAVNLAQFGVVLFFVMSGYGLTLGYRKQWDSMRFWERRYRRIVPWFWIATLATAAISGWPGWLPLALNLSFLWPVFDLRGYIATGTWAVGCEVVFYALFWLWAIAGFHRLALAVAGVGSYALGQWWLSPEFLSPQWDVWINPLVQLLPFAAGCAMALARYRWVWGWPVGLGLFLGLCLAAPTPIAVYWIRPLLIAAGCLMISHAREWEPLAKVGKVSYQIYLLHPLAWGLL